MRSLLVTALSTLVCSAVGSAQVSIATWNFNFSSGSAPFAAETGTGTMTLLAGVTSTQNTGSPSDPSPTNFGPNTTGYTAQSVGSGTAGTEFTINTTGYQDIVFTFDQRHSNTSSKFVRVDYSTDGGTTFTAGPVYSTPGGDTWNIDRFIDLSADPAADNNANLKIRVVTVFDPASGTAYAASRSTSTYAGTGTLRFDRVRVTGSAIGSAAPQVGGAFSPAAVCRGGTTNLALTITPGQNPTSVSYTVTADLAQVGGLANTPVVDGGSGYTLSVPVSATASLGTLSIPVTITDDQNRSSTSNIALAVGDCGTDSGAPVVISMIYGGGGNAGAIFNADFVEIHNRSCSPVGLDGWALQYTSAGGVNTFDGTRQVNLSGVIGPGQFRLIQTERVGQSAAGLPIPTPDFLAFPADPQGTPVPPETINGFGMSQSAGRVALTNTTTALGGTCAGASVVDVVGYGATAFCYEGAASTLDASNTLAVIRKNNGCTDSNQNFSDFESMFPRDPFNAASPAITCSTCTPAGCNLADITEVGGTEEFPGSPDGQLTVDDLILFVNLFSASTGCPGTAPCSRADVTGIGGSGAAPDGELTVDDLIEFVNAFSSGC